MSEDALIRLENLKALKLGPTELSLRVGSRTSYWSDLMAGRRSFGEKVARKIEAGLNLPRGSLDEPPESRVTIIDSSVVATSPKPILSNLALSLATMLDQIPDSQTIMKIEAHSAATQSILSVMRSQVDKKSSSLDRQKRSA